MSFLIPNFSPKTITDLTYQLGAEEALAKEDAELKAQVRDSSVLCPKQVLQHHLGVMCTNSSHCAAMVMHPPHLQLATERCVPCLYAVAVAYSSQRSGSI